MGEDDRLLGEVVGGRFRLERKLGQGGMGAVYEAVHVAIGTRVAVKVLRPAFGSDPGLARRFLREARSAAAVAHDGVVRIHDFGQTSSGAPYIVMDLLKGEPLSDRLGAEGRLAVGFAAYVGCHLLSALAAAHEAGVVHRDLKPENVFLVDTRSPLPGVKVVDFGLSKILATGAAIDEPTQLTATGVIMGTPQYMSPEHAAGQRDLDGRTDLWAVGVILYECLTGRAPFEGATPAHVLSKLCAEEPRPPRALWPELPEALEALILRALEKRREDRFASAWEMFEALEPFVEPWARAGLPRPDRPAGALFALAGEAEATATTVDPAGLPGALLDGSDETATEPVGDLRSAAGSFDDATTASPALAGPSGTLTLGPTEVASGRRRAPRWMLVAGGLAAFAALAGGAAVGVATALRRSDPSAEPALTVRQMDAGAAAGRPRAAPDASGALPPSTPVAEEVTIDLEGVPAGARVHLEEALVTELPIRLVRDGRPRTIRVEADGFEPFATEVDSTSSLVLRVALVPRAARPAAKGGPGKRPRPAEREPEPEVRPPEKRPGEYRPPPIDLGAAAGGGGGR